MVLKAPLGTPKRQINNFLEQHAGWIAEKRILMAKVATSAQPLRFVEGRKSGWRAGNTRSTWWMNLKGLVFRERRGFFAGDC